MWHFSRFRSASITEKCFDSSVLWSRFWSLVLVSFWNCFGGSPVGYRQMNLSHMIRTRTACSAHSRMDIETFDWQQLCHIHKRDSTSSLKVKESWEVHGHTICYIIKSVSCNQILSEQNSSASFVVLMWHHRNG